MHLYSLTHGSKALEASSNLPQGCTERVCCVVEGVGVTQLMWGEKPSEGQIRLWSRLFSYPVWALQAGSRVTRMTAFAPLEAQQQSDAGVNGTWVARVSGLVRCVAAAGWVQGSPASRLATPPIMAPHPPPLTQPRAPTPRPCPHLAPPRPLPLTIPPLPPQCSRRPHRAMLDPRLQTQTRQPSSLPRAFYVFLWHHSVNLQHY